MRENRIAEADGLFFLNQKLISPLIVIPGIGLSLRLCLLSILRELYDHSVWTGQLDRNEERYWETGTSIEEPAFQAAQKQGSAAHRANAQTFTYDIAGRKVGIENRSAGITISVIKPGNQNQMKKQYKNR